MLFSSPSSLGLTSGFVAHRKSIKGVQRRQHHSLQSKDPAQQRQQLREDRNRVEQKKSGIFFFEFFKMLKFSTIFVLLACIIQLNQVFAGNGFLIIRKFELEIELNLK